VNTTANNLSQAGVTTLQSPQFTTNSANQVLLDFFTIDAPAATPALTVTNVTTNGTGGPVWPLVRRTNTRPGTTEVWRAFAPTVLTNCRVVATFSRASRGKLTVISFNGADTTGSGAGTIGANASFFGGTPTGAANITGSVTTTRNNSWVFGVGNDWDVAQNAGTGQTMISRSVSNFGDTFWVQRRTTTTPTSGTAETINDTAPKRVVGT
jgi:hypothetical protein